MANGSLPKAPFGFLNVNKPLYITSHDVVAKVRRKLGIRQVGHAGTLDPLASGVLIVCVGRATRLSDYVMASVKQYRATVRFGAFTTTDDAEGEISAQHDASGLTSTDVESALPAFIGDIEQLPPMYSAIKQGGKKLYDIARAGQTVERKLRPVSIQAITLTAWNPPEATLEVTCGSGTYIRSLARDLGAALGVGAYLSGLVRTASGAFNIAQAVTLDEWLATDTPTTALIPPQTALAHAPSLTLTPEQIRAVLYGQQIEQTTPLDAPTVFAYTGDGDLIAILRGVESRWQPLKVFALNDDADDDEPPKA